MDRDRAWHRGTVATPAEQGLKNADVLEPFREVGAVDDTFSAGGAVGNDEPGQQLKKFFEDVSRRLHQPKMARPDDPWKREKVEDRLLGYGNTAQRLVFYYNVPTVTLTPLWLAGEGWKPLFRRREKPRTRLKRA